MNDSVKIGIIGLGYVGLPLAALLAREFQVMGYDRDVKRVESLKAGIVPISEPGLPELLQNALSSGKLTVTSNPGELGATDVKIITVGTPYDEHLDKVDFSQLLSSLSDIKNALKFGDVVMLKSTVTPGTTEGMVKDFIESIGFKVPSEIGLAFSPERMIEGRAVKDFQELPKIVGASDDRTYGVAKRILTSLGGTISRVSNATTAELVKMVDNYSRYVFLGLTNEIALMSEAIGVDVLEVISAAKRDYPRNAGILLPGPGVGGSCLNKDPFILRENMQTRGLELKMVNAAKTVNRNMPSRVAEIVSRFSNGRRSILVAGLAFKGDTDDTRYSTFEEISAILEKTGFLISYSDPYVKSPSIHNGSDIYSDLKGKDVLLLLTDHGEYKTLNLERIKELMARNPVIVDTRGIIERREAERIGFEYHGLGRL